MYSPEYTRFHMPEMKAKTEPCQKQGSSIGRPTCRRDTPTPSIPSQAKPPYFIIPQRWIACRGWNKDFNIKFFGKAPLPCWLRSKSTK